MRILGLHLLLVSGPGLERSFVESHSSSTGDHDADDDDDGAASVGEAVMRGRRQYG